MDSGRSDADRQNVSCVSEWEAARPRSLFGFMLIFLEAIAIVVLVAVSLIGFAAALAWTLATWFGTKG